MILKKLYSEKRNLPLQTSEKNARKKNHYFKLRKTKQQNDILKVQCTCSINRINPNCV